MTAPPEPASMTVGEQEAGQTVAALVRRLVPQCPWSRARTLCRQGYVHVDGQAVLDPAARVEQGRVVEVRRRPEKAARDAREVTILSVDREVVVVDKPPGLNSVPFEPDERDTLQHRVQDQLRRRFGPSPPLRVVQRLDRDTTGVLVFARTRRAERALQVQFREHTVQRRYLGLALGEVRSATRRSHLVSDRGDGLRGSWRGSKPPRHAKEAVTHVEVLDVARVDASTWTAEGDGLVSLVSCRLETGRQHQIRIHLAESGHPLVGERVYVRDYRGGFVREFEPPKGRPLLHAHTLGFVHPQDDRLHRFESPLPDDFRRLIEALALKDPVAKDG